MSRVLLLLALLPAAASAPSGSVDDELTARRATTVPIDASLGVVFGLRWRQPIVRSGHNRTVIESFGRPAVSTLYGVTVFGQGEGQVRAVRLDDGREVWRHSYKSPFESSVTLVEPGSGHRELAVVPARDGAVLALDVLTGEIAWKGSVDAESRTRATRAGDTLLFTTVTNQVVALAAHTGKTLWATGRPARPGLSVEGHSAATVADGVVYAAFSDGYVESYRLEDGSRLWSRPLSFTGDEFLDADADPIVADGRLYVASYSDGVYALELADGKTVWTRSGPSVVSLALFDAGEQHLLLAASADGWVWGLQRSGGTLAYRTALPPGPMSRLQVRDGVAVLAAGRSGLIVLDARSGRPMQATSVTGWLGSNPEWVGKHLTVIASTGHLYTFSLGDAGLVN